MLLPFENKPFQSTSNWHTVTSWTSQCDVLTSFVSDLFGILLFLRVRHSLFLVYILKYYRLKGFVFIFGCWVLSMITICCKYVCEREDLPEQVCNSLFTIFQQKVLATVTGPHHSFILWMTSCWEFSFGIRFSIWMVTKGFSWPSKIVGWWWKTVCSGGSRISLRWGRQLSRGRQYTILPNSSKNCMKLKEFGPPGRRGAHPSCPLDPHCFEIIYLGVWMISKSFYRHPTKYYENIHHIWMVTKCLSLPFYMPTGAETDAVDPFSLI